MQNVLAVYTGKRAFNGRELTNIAREHGISLRFLAMGGYIPGNDDEIQSKALTKVNGGALLIVGAFPAENTLISEFDALVVKGDQQPIAAILNDGKLPWCELYTGTFDYEKAIKVKPKDQPKIDGSVANAQLPALRSAKVRYIIYNQARRKNCGELMKRLAEAIATSSEGIVADYQRPSR